MFKRADRWKRGKGTLSHRSVHDTACKYGIESSLKKYKVIARSMVYNTRRSKLDSFLLRD